jgi:Family of unknown function (DUF6152)
MKSSSVFVLTTAFALTIAVVPAAAHHSFAAQYDRNKPVTLTGPVTKIDWINPHARIFIDAKDATGKIVNWEIELGAPAILLRNGWTKKAITIGESVTVSGSLAKDGSNLANATSVTLADGKKVFAGSSGGDGETK